MTIATTIQTGDHFPCERDNRPIAAIFVLMKFHFVFGWQQQEFLMWFGLQADVENFLRGLDELADPINATATNASIVGSRLSRSRKFSSIPSEPLGRLDTFASADSEYIVG
jgi:hypothetical protein